MPNSRDTIPNKVEPRIPQILHTLDTYSFTGRSGGTEEFYRGKITAAERQRERQQQLRSRLKKV